jgi:hypothetical protein
MGKYRHTYGMGDVRSAEAGLLPCPFCGKRFGICVTDGEGNIRGGEYLDDPWSGVGFGATHDSPDCPIGGDPEEFVSWSDTPDGLVREMNRRAPVGAV